MKNYCFTLCYNLVSEVEKVTKLLYEQNSKSDFTHLIVDLGFPLETGNEIPGDIRAAKHRNTKLLKALAKVYGSDYVQMDNIGVSQNWTQVYKYIKPADDDVLIGCDPDEHTLQNGWVKAMGDVIREGDFALCSLMMTDHIKLMPQVAHSERYFANKRVYIAALGSLNWALIGISGKFFNLIKEIPFPPEAPRYGYIEACLYSKFGQYGMDWCLLADYTVRHTDFELGDKGTSGLLREWKNQIIFKVHQYGQLSFDEWLIMRKEGRI
jgi:hypothetical protein